VVTDSSQTGVRVRRLDPQLMMRLGRQGLRVLWRLRREGDDIARRYVAAQEHLTSKENWERLFSK
jgi:galactofuranosylgalactofuranosylrhamnosyl-N-acetylglucosaminyl-diphospho-decaprenol beta-1,5/1,6-galactofuranosyltransferase